MLICSVNELWTQVITISNVTPVMFEQINAKGEATQIEGAPSRIAVAWKTTVFSTGHANFQDTLTHLALFHKGSWETTSKILNHAKLGEL